jgi:hypothetical protein
VTNQKWEPVRLTEIARQVVVHRTDNLFEHLRDHALLVAQIGGPIAFRPARVSILPRTRGILPRTRGAARHR